MIILGIDVGGSGIKGAPVDTDKGALAEPRYRLPTPHPATPEACADVIAQIVDHFSWKGPIGCGVPAVVREGRLMTAANISRRWLGVDAKALLEERTGCGFSLVNDADAAGLAEVTFGAGRGRHGLVIVVTLGTGIGTALLIDGRLVPNTELGHLEVGGREAERWASDRVRSDKELSWKKWARRLDTYLDALQRYLWPDLIILGGGVSKKSRKFIPRLTVSAEVVAAELRNEAGIIGAALASRSAAAAQPVAVALPSG